MNIAASIFFVLIIYTGIKKLYQNKWSDKLTIDISFATNEAFEGDTVKLTESITNRKLLPLPMLMIKFNVAKCLRYLDLGVSQTGNDLFDDGSNATVTDYVYRNDIVNVSAYQKKIRTLSLKCVSRGYCNINSFYIICSDFFLGSKMTQTRDCSTHIYIYPKCLDSQIFNMTFNSLMGEIITRRYINEDPFEFKGIRDYQSYDSLKSVNWKASARSMELKVNQMATTTSLQITIMLNLDCISGLRDEDLDENSIRLAATFAERFSNLGIPTAFITNAHDNFTGNRISISHGCGSNHYKTILMSLARLGINKYEPADFAALLNDTLMSTSEHNFFIIISSTTSSKIANILDGKNNNVKYIIPIRPDNTINAQDSIAKCATMWTVNY